MFKRLIIIIIIIIIIFIIIIIIIIIIIFINIVIVIIIFGYIPIVSRLLFPIISLRSCKFQQHEPNYSLSKEVIMTKTCQRLRVGSLFLIDVLVLLDIRQIITPTTGKYIIVQNWLLRYPLWFYHFLITLVILSVCLSVCNLLNYCNNLYVPNFDQVLDATEYYRHTLFNEPTLLYHVPCALFTFVFATYDPQINLNCWHQNRVLRQFPAHLHARVNDKPSPCIWIGGLSNLWMYTYKTIIVGLILKWVGVMIKLTSWYHRWFPNPNMQMVE